MTLKAWRVNEYEVYAAETLDQAVELCMKDTGNSYDEVLDCMYARELLPDETVSYEDAPSDDLSKTTVGALLHGVKNPGLLFSIED